MFDDISKMISGWERSPPDARDWLYHEHHPVTAATVAALPEFVDLSVGVRPPLSSHTPQGNIGSCGPHTACRDTVYAAFKEGLDKVPSPSRLFWYYCARDIMGTVNRDSGVFNRALCQVASKFGWCDEQLHPYDTRQYRTRPPAAAYQQAEGRKCDRYLAVDQNLDVMKTAIANGDPIIFGFTVFENMNEAARNGGKVPMPRGRAVGGHDVLLVGYDDRTRMFKADNWWGTEYGDRGYIYIPYYYATNARYSGDFWTIQGSGLPVPPPPEPPTPPDDEVKGHVVVDVGRKTVTVPKGWTVGYVG